MFPKSYGDRSERLVTKVRTPAADLTTLVESRVPPLGATASGPFFCHEDNLGQFVLKGMPQEVLRDIDGIIDSYVIKYE